jgi:hypothetical protein
MNKVQLILCILVSPLTFIISLPIEYPLWKEYRKQGYDVPGYLKFFWNRCVVLNDVTYKKIGSDE